ncbi:hypothetical protein MBAV_006143 [Candidatus Magnetobacterium bavaricum]|uniref:Uncharacterized protein n=1 Tax=Candidatus Magnetobacterium bavaricum TaxID=29290 RepID=A0A0F3GI79_9BACT|nr:hypothetical protein MBAV_006143 [Candidatus Magnetobacterium bavaricum]
MPYQNQKVQDEDYEAAIQGVELLYPLKKTLTHYTILLFFFRPNAIALDTVADFILRRQLARLTLLWHIVFNIIDKVNII